MESGRLTAVAALAVTLGLGTVLGAVGAGALRRDRPPPREPPPSDFPQRILAVVQPRDDGQRARVEPILLATDARNRATVDSARTLLTVHLEEMARSLDSVLDRDQRARLDDFVMDARRALLRPPGLGPAEGPPRPGEPRPRDR